MAGLFDSLQSNEEIVKEILRVHPQARDSDKFLYLVYLRDYKSCADYMYSFKKFMDAVMDSNVATPETLSRIRRKLQSKGEFLGKRHKERQNECQQEVKDWVRS